MKTILIAVALLLSAFAQAEESRIIPVFLEAARLHVEGVKSSSIHRPQIQAVLQVLREKNVDPDLLAPLLTSTKGQRSFTLPRPDQFDAWKKAEKFEGEVPEVSLHAFKMDVIKRSEIMFKDDIYVYFFVTDGVIPTGKVSSIYKGVNSGDSFFLNEIDRAIFPLVGIPAKRPDSHLIVDYGIIESDGDDIKKLQKLSSIIIDIAIAVYGSYDPQSAEILIKLRQEIKALADLLIGLNSDDRLVTSSFGFKAKEIADLLRKESYVEFKQKHSKDETFDSFEYHLNFRLLRK